MKRSFFDIDKMRRNSHVVLIAAIVMVLSPVLLFLAFGGDSWKALPVWAGSHAVADFAIPSAHSTTLCGVTEAASIGTLPDVIDAIKKCDGENERFIAEAFDRIYIVNRREGSLNIPDTFAPKVRKWLGNNEAAYAQVFRQRIVSVMNKYTGENSIFNPLRALRPGANTGGDSVAYVDGKVEETQGTCDFCNYKEQTAADVFGRVEGRFSVTAANTFKYDGFHGLVLFRSHHPLHFNRAEFLDFCETAAEWFRRAHARDTRYVYPHLMWDLLPKASASQLHPHAQASLSPDRYYGMGETFRAALTSYARDTAGRNYFVDLISLHDGLGLSVHHGDAVAIAHLTPKKEHEVMVIAPSLSRDLAVLLHAVLRAFIDDAGIYAFSLGAFFPPMTPSATGEPSLPAVVRVIDRGAPTSDRSDISAMELFAASNVNADPFKVAAKIRDAVRKKLADETA
eukprot:Opistho-2@72679